MKEKKMTISLLLIMVALITNAQTSTNASGNNLVSTGGTISYSIGQIDNNSYISSSGTVTQGIQQPYELFVVSIDENQTIDNKIKVYPNPTKDKVIVINCDKNSLTLSFYNSEGKLLKAFENQSNLIEIDINDFPKGIYLLQVKGSSAQIEKFKIIKY